MINVDATLRKMAAIGDLTIFCDANNMISVRYKDYDIKDGPVILTACGRGFSLEQALREYIDRINGKTLVNDSGHEVKVLILDGEAKTGNVRGS